ncbi:hypothetical protein [Saccharomonospora halophila]|uniref:hypothetical protein n=1 Tax=Saccharomonospora halophila TaxID=129922 RepID=UPI0018DC584E|nr:hypothetical protein [Saccharomonospora halophila]
MVVGRAEMVDVEFGADAPIGGFGGAGALGGVLGDVARQRLIGNPVIPAVVVGGGDVANVELVTPPQCERGAVRPVGAHDNGLYGGSDGVSEQGGGGPGRGTVAGTTGSVEAD